MSSARERLDSSKHQLRSSLTGIIFTRAQDLRRSERLNRATSPDPLTQSRVVRDQNNVLSGAYKSTLLPSSTEVGPEAKKKITAEVGRRMVLQWLAGWLAANSLTAHSLTPSEWKRFLKFASALLVVISLTALDERFDESYMWMECWGSCCEFCTSLGASVLSPYTPAPRVREFTSLFASLRSTPLHSTPLPLLSSSPLPWFAYSLARKLFTVRSGTAGRPAGRSVAHPPARPLVHCRDRPSDQGLSLYYILHTLSSSSSSSSSLFPTEYK